MRRVKRWLFLEAMIEDENKSYVTRMWLMYEEEPRSQFYISDLKRRDAI